MNDLCPEFYADQRQNREKPTCAKIIIRKSFTLHMDFCSFNYYIIHLKHTHFMAVSIEISLSGAPSADK